MNINVSIISISTLLFLTACGGGGSDSNASSTPATLLPTETSPISISSSNIEQTSSSAISAVFNNLALNTADGITGVVIDEDQNRVDLSDIDWALKWLTKAPLVTDSVTGVITTEIVDCAINGTTTITSDLQNSINISVNDSFTFQSNNCNDGQEITNGGFTFTFTKLVNFSSLESYSELGIKIDYNNFAFTFAGETVNIVGSYTLLHKQDVFSDQQSITADEISISFSQFQQSISNLISEQVFTENTNEKTLNVSTELFDEFLKGSVTIRTINDFMFTGENAEAPFSGSMKITGAENSSILVTILNTSNVQLDSDFDGNNTIDDTRVISWNSLN